MYFDILIIGSDINAYYMARSYHEAYNRKANLIGRKEMAFTSFSTILNIETYSDLNEDKRFVSILNEFAEKNKGNKILLVGTNDEYVKMIVKNKKKLSNKFIFNYPKLTMINDCLNKEKFYLKYKDSSLPMPITEIYNCSKGDKIPEFKDYPIIVKPADGIAYYECDFEGKAKVFKVKSQEELADIVSKIEKAGYKGSLIIQEFIPGDDYYLYDALFYCDKAGEAKIMTFAQIGLQEQTISGVGNLTVLINGFDQQGYSTKIVEKLANFLDEIGYTGFAEVDLKYDIRTGEYKVLEINPRQSRSGYYMTAAGFNMIKLLVDDLIYNKRIEKHIIKEELALSFIPNYCVNKYTTSDDFKAKYKELVKNKQVCRPLSYKRDMSIKRRIYLLLRKINYIKKYKNNKW